MVKNGNRRDFLAYPFKEYAIVNNHKIDFECTSILCADNVQARLFVKEALKIKELSAHLSLNRNIRGCDLKLW